MRPTAEPIENGGPKGTRITVGQGRGACRTLAVDILNVARKGPHFAMRPLATISIAVAGHLMTAFCVAAPPAWNTLPTQLKLLRSTTAFRRQLNTVLLQSTCGVRTPGYRLMRWVLGLSVGGAMQIPQLQIQLQFYPCRPGARFTKYLTIYRKIILYLS